MQRNLSEWLAHERRGAERDAERALASLLSDLPMPVVTAGFADRVLSSRRTLVRRQSWSTAYPWVWKAAFGIWLVTAFLVAGGAAGLANGFAHSGVAVGVGSRLAVGLGRLASETVIALDGIARASQAVLTAFSGPLALAFLLACALASLLAMRALVVVMVPERSTRHA